MAETAEAEVIESPPIEKGSLAIIERAVALKLGADELGKLVALHERLEAKRAEQEFNRDMRACQHVMPTVIRDAENKGTRSRYALRETINKAIKPVYTDHGFSLSFTTEDSPLQGHVRIACDVRHTEGHTVRYRADIPLDGQGSQGGKSAMNAPQATGSTFSYGCRYLTCLIFNVTVANEDDDGQGRSVQITEVEAELIGALCRQKGRDVVKFLAWLDAPDFASLTRQQFLTALADLRRRNDV